MMKPTPVYPKTEAEVVALVRTIARTFSVREAARQLHVSPTYVQKVCAGEMPPGPKVLKGLGLRRVVTYVKA